MKVQLSADDIRVRVSEAELAALRGGEPLRLQVGGDPPLLWVELVLAEQARLYRTASAPAHWSIALPRPAVDAYVATLPAREALAIDVAILPSPTASVMRIRFEVDVRDSIAVRGPRGRHA